MNNAKQNIVTSLKKSFLRFSVSKQTVTLTPCKYVSDLLPEYNGKLHRKMTAVDAKLQIDETNCNIVADILITEQRSIFKTALEKYNVQVYKTLSDLKEQLKNKSISLTDVLAKIESLEAGCKFLNINCENINLLKTHFQLSEQQLSVALEKVFNARATLLKEALASLLYKNALLTKLKMVTTHDELKHIIEIETSNRYTILRKLKLEVANTKKQLSAFNKKLALDEDTMTGGYGHVYGVTPNIIPTGDTPILNLPMVAKLQMVDSESEKKTNKR